MIPAGGGAGTVLSPQQIAAVCAAAGFRGARLVDAVSVALAESGGDTEAVGGPNLDRWRSRDFGLFQFNNKWHPEVTGGPWRDPAFQAAAAFRVSKGGTTWAEWATWPALAALQRGRAQLAVGRPAGTDKGDGKGGGPLPAWLAKPVAAGIVGAVQSPVGDVVQGAADVGTAVAGIGRTIADAQRWLNNPRNTMRIVQVVGGTAALLLGLAMLARTDVGGPVGAVARAPGAAVKTAAKAVPAARAVRK